jgi:hypothetical protein
MVAFLLAIETRASTLHEAQRKPTEQSFDLIFWMTKDNHPVRPPFYTWIAIVFQSYFEPFPHLVF